MDINSAYNAAMSSAIPGTFVPDIGAADPKTEAIPGGADSSGVASFKDTVKSYLDDVNNKVTESDQLSRDLATGRTNDVGKVVSSVEEANLAMEFTLAIRNKLLSAYTSISQMQM
ncbi:MAG TPA: flagellar hook-basal body complex protein FliE [Candidatus Baltobacteraceae bacterium]|jgi:flagellar hook-basal body complex protein FliE|nr:flagellar hook-basal body complex protein FliE [Candidatus Baltobacteraceae bacterium]